MISTDLSKLLFDAFADDIAVNPEVTLRGGNHLDDHCAPPPYDPVADKVSDDYMESFHWGVAHLDSASWRHYLPQLANYVVHHFNQGTLVGEATVASLCAPDRDPPRLATLTPRQEHAVTEFLEFLAFTDGSAHRVDACRAIDEWWSPNAMYRIRPDYSISQKIPCSARSSLSLVPLMLSTHTLKLLDELCAKSKDQYPDGGILWTFVEAASQAHFRFKDSRREPQAGAMDLMQLGAWVQGALGGANSPQEPVAAVSISIANELLRALKDDLQVDEFLWTFEDGGGDMTGNIYMARNFDNRYFALEMWWSVD